MGTGHGKGGGGCDCGCNCCDCYSGNNCCKPKKARARHGATGATGVSFTGATGVSSTGATGVSSTGATGAGATGATGATGVGSGGATGATGAGATGAGATGATGVGSGGATGATGAGATGSTGPGATGATGPGISNAIVTFSGLVAPAGSVLLAGADLVTYLANGGLPGGVGVAGVIDLPVAYPVAETTTFDSIAARIGPAGVVIPVGAEIEVRLVETTTGVPVDTGLFVTFDSTNVGNDVEFLVGPNVTFDPGDTFDVQVTTSNTVGGGPITLTTPITISATLGLA